MNKSLQLLMSNLEYLHKARNRDFCAKGEVQEISQLKNFTRHRKRGSYSGVWGGIWLP